MTNEQKERLRDILEQMDEKEVDTILVSMHNFVDWLYSAARDIYNAVKYTLQSVWNWIKSIFS